MNLVAKKWIVTKKTLKTFECTYNPICYLVVQFRRVQNVSGQMSTVSQQVYMYFFFLRVGWEGGGQIKKIPILHFDVNVEKCRNPLACEF